METLAVGVELRDADDGPHLHGTIIQEGRAARGGRAELFAPGAIVWPASGVAIKTEHRGRAEAHAVPTRDASGNIGIAVKATPAMVQAVRNGRDHMSVEFHPLREHRTAGGVREIVSALVDAVALTDDPEYAQTAVELRNKRRRKVWL